MIEMKFLSKWSNEILGVTRIVSAFMFIQHGTRKLLDFPIERFNEVPVFSLITAAGVLELVGGALLLLGLFTRPVAFVLSGEMAFAYFINHAPVGFWTIENGGDAAVLYCFLFLYIAAVGSGRWSLDNVLFKR